MYTKSVDLTSLLFIYVYIRARRIETSWIPLYQTSFYSVILTHFSKQIPFHEILGFLCFLFCIHLALETPTAGRQKGEFWDFPLSMIPRLFLMIFCVWNTNIFSFPLWVLKGSLLCACFDFFSSFLSIKKFA